MGWLSHKLSEILSATHCTHDSSFPDNLHTKLHNGSTIKKTYKQGSRPARGINFEVSILAACMSRSYSMNTQPSPTQKETWAHSCATRSTQSLGTDLRCTC